MRDQDDPEFLCCPLTLEPFIDPVITLHGSTFERSAIEEWFKRGNCIDPCSMEKLDSTALISNNHIKVLVDAWREGQVCVIETPTEVDEAKEDLIAAAKVGDAPRVRELLKAGADPTSLNADGLSALHLASIHGHGLIVQLLLGAGAPPDLSLFPGRETPLFLAARYGRKEIVSLLANKGANINATRRCGFITALDESSLRGHVMCCIELIKRNATRLLPGITLADKLTHVERCLDKGNPDAAEYVLRAIEFGSKSLEIVQLHSAVATYFKELWNRTTQARVKIIHDWPEPPKQPAKLKRRRARIVRKASPKKPETRTRAKIIRQSKTQQQALPKARRQIQESTKRRFIAETSDYLVTANC